MEVSLAIAPRANKERIAQLQQSTLTGVDTQLTDMCIAPYVVRIYLSMMMAMGDMRRFTMCIATMTTGSLLTSHVEESPTTLAFRTLPPRINPRTLDPAPIVARKPDPMDRIVP